MADRLHAIGARARSIAVLCVAVWGCTHAEQPHASSAAGSNAPRMLLDGPTPLIPIGEKPRGPRLSDTSSAAASDDPTAPSDAPALEADDVAKGDRAERLASATEPAAVGGDVAERLAGASMPVYAEHSTHATYAASRAVEPSWAKQVGRERVDDESRRGAWRIEQPRLVDTEYASDESVEIRRLVYRMTVLVPPALRGGRPRITPPAGELHVDVSEHRLRARFVGPGWPIDEGSEIRLRSDVPGVYLFDADGGRTLLPGQLSAWFHGQLAGIRVRTDLQIREELAASAPRELHFDDGPGELFCVLLAEWTGSPRDDALHRCGGFAPLGFRFGVFSAERMALVPLSVPRSLLRADASAPPARPRHLRVRPLLAPGELARIPASPALRAKTPPAAMPLTAATTPAADGGSGLTVDNRVPARVVAIVQGVPIAWIDALSAARFEGLPAGGYRVAALRTSTGLAITDGPLMIPGELRVQRGHVVLDDDRSAQLSEPLLGSPAAAR